VDAVETAIAVAREHDVRCEDPVVLRDAWHVLVHLRPAPIVARVSGDAPGTSRDDVARELAVASHAAHGGAPVVPPSPDVDPGPHTRDGRLVTFWQYVVSDGELDPQAAGRGLRAIHDALADFDGELPEGHDSDTRALLDSLEPSEDVDFLRELADRGLPALQALHGDAHLGNCLQTTAGPVWHDFETACRGPREYDLAALVMRHRQAGDPRAEAALRAYGRHDEAVLDAALPAYAAWICASFAVSLPRRPELADALKARVEWLRELVR
jgi:Phosphotransferase enzyme family